VDARYNGIIITFLILAVIALLKLCLLSATGKASKIKQKCSARNARRAKSSRNAKRDIDTLNLPPKNIGVLQPWDKVHIDLIGPYTVSALQQRPGQQREMTELSLIAMTFIDPATG